MSEKTNIKRIKILLELVDKHKLDYLEVDGIKITKTKHRWEEATQSPQKQTTPPTDEDEELLFWSAN